MPPALRSRVGTGHVREKKDRKKRGKASPETPFWEKQLSDLTRAQWEKPLRRLRTLLLVKLEDEDTRRDPPHQHRLQAARSGELPLRRLQEPSRQVPDCIRLTLAKLQTIQWLPPTCAYVLRNEGKPLPPWHPLISGDPDSVHDARVSVRDKVEASEEEVDDDDTPDFIRTWPKRWPKKARY